MMHISNLNCLLPVPREVRVLPGSVEVESLKTIRSEASLERFSEELSRTFAFFGARLRPAEGKTAAITFSIDELLPVEGWRLKITEENVSLAGGSPAGVFYGVGALKQLLTLAFATGGKGPHLLDCGEVTDAPCYSWRGYMLDGARHFQSVALVKDLIRHLADYRINILHWHLTDSQGWRTPSRLVPELKTLGSIETGQYTRAQIREIEEYAAAHFIKIVPEIEMPGHSGGLLGVRPELGCDPAHPGHEFCLGNPATKQFLKELLKEFVELFPRSDTIHLGGDEAETETWAKCPRCKAALKQSKLRSFRELESAFMAEMSREVLRLGRTPMVWATESVLPPDTVVQGWTSLYDISRAVERGNKMVFSVHHHVYYDYPQNAGEPASRWMPLLPDQTVYATDPRVHLGEQAGESLLGVEACLWTEIVPHWRVLPKTLPRLPALSEVAWSPLEKRNWHDFLRRREKLEACGYHVVRDSVRSLSDEP